MILDVNLLLILNLSGVPQGALKIRTDWEAQCVKMDFIVVIICFWINFLR
jgi:hypothetical protein